MLEKKQKRIVLFINLAILAWSAWVFFSKGLPSGIYNWRFYASLIGFLVFLILTSLFVYKVFVTKTE